jgi:hypothetical protein
VRAVHDGVLLRSKLSEGGLGETSDELHRDGSLSPAASCLQREGSCVVGGGVSIIPGVGSWKDGESLEKDGGICGVALVLTSAMLSTGLPTGSLFSEATRSCHGG